MEASLSVGPMKPRHNRRGATQAAKQAGRVPPAWRTVEEDSLTCPVPIDRYDRHTDVALCAKAEWEKAGSLFRPLRRIGEATCLNAVGTRRLRHLAIAGCRARIQLKLKDRSISGREA